MPEDPPQIDRRTFVVVGVCACAAAGLALAGCGLSVATAPDSVGGSLKISDYAALSAVGGVALATVSGTPLAIVRTGSTTFLALSRICPHQGATVNLFGNGFLCPRHGAQFDASGTWIGGQRTSSMRSYATSYDAATGTLTIG